MPTSPEDLALARLVARLKACGVPPMEDAPAEWDGLAEDERRVLQYLRQRARGSAPPEDPAPPGKAPRTWQPSAQAEPPAPYAEDSETVTDGPGNIPKVANLGVTEAANPASQRITLRNGRVGQPYSVDLPGYDDLELIDDDGAGLTLGQGRLSGSPEAAGSFALKLTATQEGTPVTLSARLSIIANPRDLWTSEPSDRLAQFWKPDEAFATATGDGLIVAASKRGRSHAREGGFREDHFAIHADGPGQWQFLAVADGAGSATYAREGSRIACETAVAALPDLAKAHLDPLMVWDLRTSPQDLRPLFQPVLSGAAMAAARALEQAARDHGADPADLSTTLVLAMTRKIGDHWLTATFSVGDGGAAIFDANSRQVAVLCNPDSGAYAGQTRFLTTGELAAPEEVAQRIFVDLRRDFTVLAVMTDGITDPKFPTEADLADPDQWQTFWAEDLGNAVSFAPNNPVQGAAMLDWLDFWSRGNHDDRTLAVLVPLTGATQQEPSD